MLVPGTRTVLFSAFTGPGSRLAALDLDSGAITRFDQPGFSPQWVAAGFVTLGSSDGSLIALPFDAKRGSAERAACHDHARRGTTRRDLSLARRYRPAVPSSTPKSGGNAPRRLVLVGRSGSAIPSRAEARLFASPRFSPDGRRLALGITDRDGSEGHLGLRYSATHLVAPHDQRDQQSARLDARWPPSGLFQQRRPLVDRCRRQRASREPAGRQRQPVRRYGHP